MEIEITYSLNIEHIKYEELAIQNPPTQGDRVKVFNQVTETHSLKSLADLIQTTFPNVERTTVQNPRNELQASSSRQCSK
jgi:hypothetical protein